MRIPTNPQKSRKNRENRPYLEIRVKQERPSPVWGVIKLALLLAIVVALGCFPEVIAIVEKLLKQLG